MITIGSFTLTAAMAAIAFVGVVWLVTLITAMIAPEPAAGVALRRCDIIAIVTTVAFAASWWAVVFEASPKEERKAQSAAVARSNVPCAFVKIGDTEASVRARLGPPPSTRDEKELRGPGAIAWVYPDSRCAVRMFGGKVESIE